MTPNDPLSKYYDDQPRKYPLTWVQSAANNRTLRRLLCCCLLVLAIQAVANTTLALRHEKENYLYEVNTGRTHVVKIEHASQELRANDLLLLSLCRGLVADMESIDEASFADRDKRVRFMTTPEVYDKYQARQRPLYQKGVVRTVELLNATRLGPDVAVIEYDLTEHYSGQSKTLPAKSFITFEFFDQEVEIDDRYINPIGLVAVDYTPGPR
jgi:type IV secretory pathway component VirB8